MGSRDHVRDYDKSHTSTSTGSFLFPHLCRHSPTAWMTNRSRSERLRDRQETFATDDQSDGEGRHHVRHGRGLRRTGPFRLQGQPVGGHGDGGKIACHMKPAGWLCAEKRFTLLRIRLCLARAERLVHALVEQPIIFNAPGMYVPFSFPREMGPFLPFLPLSASKLAGIFGWLLHHNAHRSRCSCRRHH